MKAFKQMTQCHNDSMIQYFSFLSILDSFPESNPNVEQAEAGRDAARETAGHDGVKSRIRKEQRIVRPLGTPGQNHQHHSERRAQKNK